MYISNHCLRSQTHSLFHDWHERFCAFIQYLGRACTVALRYSAVRRQFPVPALADDNGNSKSNQLESEQPVLNYVTQQYQLLPLLGAAYACHFAGAYVFINQFVLRVCNFFTPTVYCIYIDCHGF